LQQQIKQNKTKVRIPYACQEAQAKDKQLSLRVYLTFWTYNCKFYLKSHSKVLTCQYQHLAILKIDVLISFSSFENILIYSGITLPYGFKTCHVHVHSRWRIILYTPEHCFTTTHAPSSPYRNGCQMFESVSWWNINSTNISLSSQTLSSMFI